MFFLSAEVAAQGGLRCAFGLLLRNERFSERFSLDALHAACLRNRPLFVPICFFFL